MFNPELLSKINPCENPLKMKDKLNSLKQDLDQMFPKDSQKGKLGSLEMRSKSVVPISSKSFTSQFNTQNG